MDIKVALAFIASFVTVLVVTPLVMKFAIIIGAVDKPNERKVHTKLMPRLGGLAIFIGAIVGYFVSGLYNERMTGIITGAVIIVILGILDDKYELSAKKKFLVQVFVGIIVVSTGLTIDFMQIPFFTKFELGLWAYPITVLWIVGITNAINLIDGLDGLAAGISIIGITTIAIMAGAYNKVMILTLAVILIGSILAFLFYNFHPAKIFMGDTGALFLGYSISILSLLGLYKSVTLFSFIVPIIILGVPIFDTFFAIIRRIVNKVPISSPDKSHLHHRLMAIGLTHRQTVLVIYGFGIIFAICALLLKSTTLWGTLLILFGLIILSGLVAEIIGLVSDKYKYRPFLRFYKKVFGKQ